MIKLVLPALASMMILSSPTAALAIMPPSSAVLDDHPAPPWESTAECDEKARRYARNHAQTTYVWDPMYVYYYYLYYDGDESMGAFGCPLI